MDRSDEIPEQIVQESVAEFFVEILRGLVCDTVVNTYNGSSKLHAESKFFWVRYTVYDCIKSQKSSEGYGRLPHRTEPWWLRGLIEAQELAF